MGISARTIRRWSQPILFNFWFRRGALGISKFRVDGFDLRIFPTVFHPKYFGSSLIFGRFIETLDIKNKRFLDMGAGSGIIGLYAARSGAQVTAVDVNPEAVRCSAENAAAAGFGIRSVESDLFAASPEEVFDVIAWNPPFFPRPALTIAEAALYAGPGHDVIRRFAATVRKHLAPGGVIYLIFSLDGGLDDIESIFREAAFSIRHARTERWGLAETMVILEVR